MMHSDDQVDLLAHIGVAVLLFLVGIKLDIKLVRSLGAVALVTGLGQVAFTSIFGFLIAMALGLDATTSFYVAVALTFSSTIIIVKLLTDKREIDSLHGQIALGFLIVQDLVVVIAMIALSALGVKAEGAGGQATVVKALVYGGVGMAFLAIFMSYVATPLAERLARTSELLVIFALTQAVAFAAISDYAGLGKELGGLIAGMSLASNSYRETIAARLAPLRDFLLVFFFIELGAAIDTTHLATNLMAAAIFSIFVLIGNPLIVLAIMGVMGYRKRTGFLAGLTVAQISEFSLIFIAMGVSLGYVRREALGLVTMVGLITIAASTYMIVYSHELYALCEPLLGVFERKGAPRERRENPQTGAPFDVVIFGLGRFGGAIGSRLKAQGLRPLGVDFNPVAVRRWRNAGIDGEYGDATDPEFVANLPLAKARWVLSTIPFQQPGLSHDDSRKTLLQIVRGLGYRGAIAVTSHSARDKQDLLSAGADVVLEPFQDAATRAVEIITVETTPARGSSVDAPVTARHARARAAPQD
jgi:Kef-type K+ transport system membrane component KefB